MRAAGISRWLTLLAALCAVACSEAPDPLGETVLTVDTDLPVPKLAARVRLDLYDKSGGWYESREISRVDPRDWPFSFSVVSRDENADRDVLVRLRVFPDGKLRDYRGERYAPRPKHVEPVVAHSVDELCQQASQLPLGKTVTLRRGVGSLVGQMSGACAPYMIQVGSVAAYVDIVEAGSYRFAVLDAPPWSQNGAQFQNVALELRRTCSSSAGAVACDPGASGQYTVYLPELTAALQPGRYYLVTAGFSITDGPSDITLAAARDDLWGELELQKEVEVAGQPIHLRGDAALTPPSEPQPNLTVDRLLALHLRPGQVERASVLLRGACLGTMAHLGKDGLPDLETAETCVDAADARMPVDQAPRHEGSASAPGAFDQASRVPCEPDESSAEVVCVPGGQFILGAVSAGGQGDRSGVPERLAQLPKFWLDRSEVTVARWRDALAKGFVPGPSERPRLAANCHFAPTPGSYEDYALNCIPWYGARAFCKFVGGDLPTEAEWEYAGAAAAREHETTYPWGEDKPQCSCDGAQGACHTASFGRFDLGVSPKECEGFGAEPVAARTDLATGDVSMSLSIFGLAGGMREWVKDAFESYDSPCWRDNALSSPECWQQEAPSRTQRGGSFGYGAVATSAAMRETKGPRIVTSDSGFRCAYATRPGAGP